MKRGDRTLGKFRKDVIEILQSFDYQYENKKPKRKTLDVHAQLYGPQIDHWPAEHALKRFNKGEAYYRLEMDVCMLENAWWDLRPQSKTPKTFAQVQEMVYNRLLFGYEFSYGEHNENYECIKYIDFDTTKNNTFVVHEGWQGVRNDDFLWDLVLTINAIPVVGVVIKKVQNDQPHCLDAYEEMRKQLDSDLCFSSMIQICVVSDGEKTLVGTPYDKFSNFKPWPSLMGEEMDVVSEAKAPFMSMLRPDRLLDILQNFNHFVYTPDGEPLYRNMSDYHQYFAVKRACNAYHESMEKGKDAEAIGTIYLPETDSQVSCSGHGDQLETALSIFVEQVTLDLFTYPDLLVKVMEAVPTDEEIEQFNEHDGRVLLIARRTVSADDCNSLLSRLRKGKIIRFDTYPAGPTLSKDFGQTLYRPKQTIAQMLEE